MDIDGIYGFVYCGNGGIGIGLFRMTGTELAGLDWGGTKYRGSVLQDDQGNIDLNLTIEVPPGVELVSGTSAQELPHTRSFTQRLPPNFGDGKPLDVVLAPGPVTIMIKRVQDHFASIIDRGFSGTAASDLSGASRPK